MLFGYRAQSGQVDRDQDAGLMKRLSACVIAVRHDRSVVCSDTRHNRSDINASSLLGRGPVIKIKGRMQMKTTPWHMLTLFGALFGLMNSATAATISYDFNLPATGIPSVGTSYPTVATLSITDVTGGVQMTLTPNWSSQGWQRNGAVTSLDIVFPSLAGSSFTTTRISGASIQSSGVSGNQNMDSSYSSNASVFSVRFRTSNNNSFDRNVASSSWSVLGNGLSTASFNGLFADANNKVSPVFGVLSVSGYSLGGVTNPSTSNWVAAVPIPAAVWLFGSGLLGLAGLNYRRRRTSGSLA
jgi:hypothetical protein